MDNELIPERSRWSKKWIWILPLSAFALIGIGICLVILQVGETTTQRENGIKFDHAKWQTTNEYDYAYRNKMLKDLVASDTLKKLNRVQVVAMLGEPTRTDGNYLFYRVSEQRMGFFILHATTLVVRISDDGTPNKVMIHE